MHGGKIFLRSRCETIYFPSHMTVTPASPEDLKEIDGYLDELCYEWNSKGKDSGHCIYQDCAWQQKSLQTNVCGKLRYLSNAYNIL